VRICCRACRFFLDCWATAVVATLQGVAHVAPRSAAPCQNPEGPSKVKRRDASTLRGGLHWPAPAIAPILRPGRLTYQPPNSSTFLLEQTNHQWPVSSIFLSEQTSTNHQPPANRTGCLMLAKTGDAPASRSSLYACKRGRSSSRMRPWTESNQQRTLTVPWLATTQFQQADIELRPAAELQQQQCKGPQIEGPWLRALVTRSCKEMQEWPWLEGKKKLLYACTPSVP
jgi:hypothetical protein